MKSGENGGSGGTRTRDERLIINGLGGAASQIASQDSGFDDDLCRLVDSWDKLSPPLKAAILAIVDATANHRGE